MEWQLILSMAAGGLVVIALLFLSMIHLFMIPKDVMDRDTGELRRRLEREERERREKQAREMQENAAQETQGLADTRESEPAVNQDHEKKIEQPEVPDVPKPEPEQPATPQPEPEAPGKVEPEKEVPHIPERER